MLRVGVLGALTLLVLAVAAALGFSGTGSGAVAAMQYGPPNTSPPTVSGTPKDGQTLTSSTGHWTGSGLTYAYQWRRCNSNGASCSDISDATHHTYKLQGVDVGTTLRVRVTATNSSGTASSTSVPTAVIAKAVTTPATGCPAGAGTAPIASVSSPARLNVDRFRFSPDPVGGATRTVVATIHVSDTCNQSVSGAMVYLTAVPFNQFTIPAEQATDSNGNVTLQMSRLRGYPSASKQRILVFFIRARRSGDSLLAGISTRRLVSTGVNLSR